MAALKLPSAAVALLLSVPASAHCDGIDGVHRWRLEIAYASARTGIAADWIERVMRAESCGRTSLNGWLTTSRAGAMGLMQLMPGTWAEMRSAYGLGEDPHQPRDNILAGAAYLRRMHDRFGYPGLFAAYNAGPARYAAHLATGKGLPLETRIYLERVTGTGFDEARPAPPIIRPGLFAVHQNAPQTEREAAPDLVAERRGGHLFAVNNPQ